MLFRLNGAVVLYLAGWLEIAEKSERRRVKTKLILRAITDCLATQNGISVSFIPFLRLLAYYVFLQAALLLFFLPFMNPSDPSQNADIVESVTFAQTSY